MPFKKLSLILLIASCISLQALSLDSLYAIPVIGALARRISPEKPQVNTIRAVRFAQVSIIGDISESTRLTEQLFSASENPYVDGILLVVDSGGGSPTHADLISEAIVRAAQHKPLICFVSGDALSAGYWIAASAPYIIGTPMTRTGSVGYVIYIQKPQADRELVFFSSDHFKFNRFNSEKNLLPDHEAYHNEHAAQGASIFRDRITLLRPALTHQALLDFQARYFLGSKGLECKLIDQVGLLKDAVKELYKRIGMPECSSIALLNDNDRPLARYSPQELV